MQECSGFEIVYREMIKGQDDSFACGERMIFQKHDALRSGRSRDVPSIHEAADAWAFWMRSEGYEVFELPRTMRTREWGLTFSVTTQGEESRVFVVGGER